MPHISIVAPVFNEQQATLIALVDRVSATVARLTDDFEIILVDDGSQNDSWRSILELAAQDPRVIGVRFARNFGQHVAISAGLDQAEGEWVVVMDSDLQDRPEVIPELYEKALEGYDVVFVERKERPESTIYRFCARIFYNGLNFLSGQDYDRRQANFSIISRRVVEAFRKVPDRSRFYGGTVRWLGFPKTAIEARHGRREFGQPSYNLLGRMRFAVRLILGYSTRLLYVAIVLGLLMSLVSFAIAAGIVVYKLAEPSLPIPGWPSLAAAVFFTAGLTNVMLGFIGLYIGELVERVRNRPAYIIRNRAGGADGGSIVVNFLSGQKNVVDQKERA